MKATAQTWQKPFFTMFGGQAFSVLGSNVVQAVITLYLANRTNSAIVLTLAMLAGYLPQAILGPLIGAFVDRTNRRITMVAADLFIALGSVVLMICFFFAEPPFYLIFIILMLRSLGQGFHEPALLSSIPMMVPKDQLARIGGYRQAVDSLATIISLAVGALLLELMPVAYIMIIDIAGAVVASMILLIWVDIPNPPPTENNEKHPRFLQGLFSDMMFGVRELAKTKGLVVLSLAMACATFICVPLSTLFILLVSRNFLGGNPEIAAVQSAFGVGMLLGSLLLGQFGKLKRRVLFMCLALIVIGGMVTIAALLPAVLFSLLVAVAGVIGLLFPFMVGPFVAMLQTLIHPSILGRVTSLVKSMIILATPLGLLIAGPLSELFGVGVWFLISGLILAALGVVCASLPSMHRLDALLEEHRD